jgi:hypothetical protein
LPATIQLDAHLHTAIDLLGPALIVDAQLEHVAVPEGEGSGLDPGGAEADVVEEGAAGGLGILDEEGA